MLIWSIGVPAPQQEVGEAYRSKEQRLIQANDSLLCRSFYADMTLDYLGTVDILPLTFICRLLNA